MGEPRPSAELSGMLDARHRLPLDDPLSDSLGRLNGQYPALTYVDRAYNVRMPLVAALFATEPIPRGSVVGVRVAAVGIWAVQRSIRGWGEFHPTAPFLLFVREERGEHAPPLVEDASVEAALLSDVLPRLLDGALCARGHVPHAELSILYTPWLLASLVVFL